MSWELLGLFLRLATWGMIAFLQLRLVTLQVIRFVGRQIHNTLMRGQRVQSTDVLRTEHRRSEDRAQMICGQGMDVSQTGHGRFIDRARRFHGQSMGILRFTAQQFSGIRDEVPRIKVSYF